MISADRDWITGANVRREAVLRHLLRAAEQMCFDYIWQPLEVSVAQGSNLHEFNRRMADLAQRRRSPSIHDYTWACESIFVQTDLARSKLTPGELEFIRNRLPRAMQQLNGVGSPADHNPVGYEPDRSFTPEVLRSFFCEFMGIGQPGILPEFARIGRKLHGSNQS